MYGRKEEAGVSFLVRHERSRAQNVVPYVNLPNERTQNTQNTQLQTLICCFTVDY
jgi:hypothetical protein